MDTYRVLVKSPSNLIIGEANFTADSENCALVGAGTILSSDEIFPYMPHGSIAEVSNSAGVIIAKAAVIVEG